MISHSSPSPLSKSPKTSGSGLSTEVVEALKFLMVFHREEGNLTECEACAAQLLDTAGPEKDEAKAMLRDLRTSSDSAPVPLASDPAAHRLCNPAAPWAPEQPGA